MPEMLKTCRSCNGNFEEHHTIKCPECNEVFCDSCYNIGDGCHCHTIPTSEIKEIAFRAIRKDPAWVSEILDLNPEEVKKIYDYLNDDLNGDNKANFPLCPKPDLTINALGEVFHDMELDQDMRGFIDYVHHLQQITSHRFSIRGSIENGEKNILLTTEFVQNTEKEGQFWADLEKCAKEIGAEIWVMREEPIYNTTTQIQCDTEKQVELSIQLYNEEHRMTLGEVVEQLVTLTIATQRFWDEAGNSVI
jgi:hypothetical protein